MSFLGAIGHLMGGSGLRELLEVIYADTAVSHILTGKAISRAIHGHILIEAMLYAIILSKIYSVPLPFKEKGVNEREGQILEQAQEDPEMMEYCLSENVTNTSKETGKGLEQATGTNVLEYSVEDILEKTAIRSISNTVVSKPDNVAESVIAESVLSNLASGDMELHEKQSTEEENILIKA